MSENEKLFTEKQKKTLIKIFNTSKVPYISFTLICFGPIFNFFLNVNNSSILLRTVLLVIGLVLMIGSWIMYFVEKKSSKKKLLVIEQLISEIEDEMNK